MSSSRARDIEALRVTVAQLAERVAVLEQRARPTDSDLIAAIAKATAGRASRLMNSTDMHDAWIATYGRS